MFRSCTDKRDTQISEKNVNESFKHSRFIHRAVKTRRNNLRFALFVTNLTYSSRAGFKANELSRAWPSRHRLYVCNVIMWPSLHKPVRKASRSRRVFVHTIRVYTIVNLEVRGDRVSATLFYYSREKCLGSTDINFRGRVISFLLQKYKTLGIMPSIAAGWKYAKSSVINSKQNYAIRCDIKSNYCCVLYFIIITLLNKIFAICDLWRRSLIVIVIYETYKWQ